MKNEKEIKPLVANKKQHIFKNCLFRKKYIIDILYVLQDNYYLRKFIYNYYK